MKTTVKLKTGAVVTRTKAKSYCENSNEKVERIEVDYDLEPEFQQVTIDTEYAMWQKEVFNNMFKSD